MIIDTFYAEPQQLSVLVKRYRDCHLDEQYSYVDSRRFVVVIPDEREEDYFDFLIEHALAMSSMNFLRRLQDDDTFAKKMLSRMAGNPMQSFFCTATDQRRGEL